MSDKETKAERGNAPQDVSRKRRALIKSAAAAAPVVLTLRSGAAAALASADTCVARDQQIAQNQGPGAGGVKVTYKNPPPSNDPWVRVQTVCRKLQGTNNQGNPITFRVYKDPTGLSSPTNWFKIPNENKIYQDSAVQMMKDVANGKEYNVIDEFDCYILVLFDQNGDIISYGQFNTSNGSDNDVGLPITNSCWASIDPMWANP